MVRISANPAALLGMVLVFMGAGVAGGQTVAHGGHVGHGDHAHGVAGPWLLHCELETSASAVRLAASLDIAQPQHPAELTQEIIVHPDLAPLHVRRYLPRAILRQTVVPQARGSGTAAVHLSIEGPTQGYKRWLIAGDWRRNRLTSFIATWRYQALADSGQRDRLLDQFGNELTRDPFVTISTAEGQGLGRLAAAPGAVLRVESSQAVFHVRKFYPHFAMDDASGKAVNVSDEFVNPAAEVEIQFAGQTSTHWLFAKFPGFQKEGDNPRPFRMTLDCPLVNKSGVPDYMLLSHPDDRLEVWTRHGGTVDVQALDTGHPVPIHGTQYVFRIEQYVPCGLLEERYESTDQRHGTPAVSVEFPSAAGGRRVNWLQPGKARVVDTPLGKLTLTLADAGAGRHGGHP